MARGIVTVINSDGMSGQVQQDETNDVFNFSGQNMAALGLTTTAPTNSCKFDIDTEVLHTSSGERIIYLAINIAVAPPLNFVPINASSSAPITANANDVITISGAGTIVSGDININGGRIIIDQGAQANPTSGVVNVTADGIIVARNGGQVNNGNININTGGSMKVVNNGQVTGTVVISQAGRMIVGNANGPGIITGTIDIKGIRAIDISAGSIITGSVPSTGGGTPITRA